MLRTLFVAGMAAALLYVPAPLRAADDVPVPLRAVDDVPVPLRGTDRAEIKLVAARGGLFRNRRPLFGRKKDEKDKKPIGPGPPKGPKPPREKLAEAEMTADGLPAAPRPTAPHFVRAVYGPRVDAEGKVTPAPPIPPAMAARRDRIRAVVDMYRPRHLNTSDRGPWEMLHGLIAWGTETRIRVGGPEGDAVSGVGWLCHNRQCRGMRLFYPSGERFGAYYGPGVQGHAGQFLAMLAQSRVPADYPLQIGGRDYTVRDLIQYEKETCHGGVELTFKLISLAHYLEPGTTWFGQDGQRWSIERLLQTEMSLPVEEVACGGTHRLMGIAYAVHRRRQQGQPVNGVYAQAVAYIHKYQRLAYQMQNYDGSMSTEWFEERGDKPDIERRSQTTGHILEWLVFSLSERELVMAPTIRSVDYLTWLLASHPDHKWPVGPLGHSIRALRLYDLRVFGPRPGTAQTVNTETDDRSASAGGTDDVSGSPTDAPSSDEVSSDEPSSNDVSSNDVSSNEVSSDGLASDGQSSDGPLSADGDAPAEPARIDVDPEVAVPTQETPGAESSADATSANGPELISARPEATKRR